MVRIPLAPLIVSSSKDGAILDARQDSGSADWDRRRRPAGWRHLALVRRGVRMCRRVQSLEKLGRSPGPDGYVLETAAAVGVQPVGVSNKHVSHTRIHTHGV